MQQPLLMPAEVDRIFRYPRGRTLRLVKAGRIECVRLPDGEIRIARETLNQILNSQPEPFAGKQAALA